MSLTGKWKIKSLATFDPEVGFKKLTIDEVFAMPEGEDKEELVKMVNVMVNITDTKLSMLAPIPADLLEEAKAEGVPVTDDGFGIMEEYDVKVEDGVYYYKTNTTGEVMGEEIDPWQELTLDEEGGLSLNPMMTFERA